MRYAWTAMADTRVTLRMQCEQEIDGRWIVEVPEFPGCMAYGDSLEEAVKRVFAITLDRVRDLRVRGELVGEVFLALPGAA